METEGPRALHDGTNTKRIAECIPVINTKLARPLCLDCIAVSLFLFFFPFSFCFCFCFCFLRRFPFSDRVDPLMKETVASRPPRSPLVAFTVGCWLRIFSTHHDHCGFLLCSFMGLQVGTGPELIRACAKVASIKRPIFKRCYGAHRPFVGFSGCFGLLHDVRVF